MRRLLPFLLLCGCATVPTQGAVVYKTVKKPVAVSCVPKGFGDPPGVHTADELKALGGPQRYLAIAADRLALLARSLQTEAVIRGCRQ